MREDHQVRCLDRSRAGDAELAEDALQQTFEAMARIVGPERILDLRAYFRRLLIRAINALHGQLGAILADDFADLADVCQGKAAAEAPRSVEEADAANPPARGWLERFTAERESLTSAAPGPSPDFAHYSEVIVTVAGQVLRSIIAGDARDADRITALRTAYPEWLAGDASDPRE